MNVYCKNCGTYDIMSVAKLYQTRSAKHGCAWIIIISCANAHDIMSVAKLYQTRSAKHGCAWTLIYHVQKIIVAY